tara:strand:+ start:248 stop:433 length:186 start_codon:yes stop_codon:yes gene_type:complete
MDEIMQTERYYIDYAGAVCLVTYYNGDYTCEVMYRPVVDHIFETFTDAVADIQSELTEGGI